MCWQIAIPAIISAVSGIASYTQGQKNEKTQEKAVAQSEDQAKTTAAQAETAITAANAKAPNTAAIQQATQTQAQAGGSGATMLTGPQGVDPKTLALGKNTLLGA